jgi:Flp pilus assembly protein TadG
MRSGRITTAKRKKERGNVLVYTVMSALFLFFAVGLGVDLSHLYLAKAELQNAADAGALAGASALTLPNPGRITTAVNRAVSTMNLNRYNFDNKTFAATMDTTAQRTLVTFAINLSGPWISEADATANPNNIRFVKVATPAVPISTFFALPILGTSTNLDARATAGLSIPGNVRYCMAPLSAVAPDPGQSFPAGYEGTCPTAGIQTYPDGTTCDPTKKFCKKCTYPIRSPGGNNAPGAGNYQVLACAGAGASEVRDALAAYGDACKCGNVSPGDVIATKPGENAGPVAQGLNVRFDIYTGGAPSYSTSTPPDLNIAEGASHGNGANQTWDGINYTQYKAGSPLTAPAAGHVGVANRRVLIIPVINAGEFGNGVTNVHVGSLGGFFMQAQAVGTDGMIKAEYIGDDIVGVVGFDPNGGATTNVVTPVLYR